MHCLHGSSHVTAQILFRALALVCNESAKKKNQLVREARGLSQSHAQALLLQSLPMTNLFFAGKRRLAVFHCDDTGEDMLSAVDLVKLITDKNCNHSNELLRKLKPAKFNRDKFVVIDRTRYVRLKYAIELIMVMPGKMAKIARKQFADTIVRYLDGDRSMCREIEANSGMSRLESYAKFHQRASSNEVPTYFVYAVKSPVFPGLIKIGTTDDVEKRLRDLNFACAPSPFVLVATRVLLRTCADFRGLTAHRREGDFFELGDADVTAYLDTLSQRGASSEAAQPQILNGASRERVSVDGTEARTLRTRLSGAVGRNRAGMVRVSPSGDMLCAIDLLRAMTGKNSNEASVVLHNINPSLFKQDKFVIIHKIRYVTFRDAIQLIMVLPGDKVAAVRKQFVDVITRYLNGDRAMCDEIEANQAMGGIQSYANFAGEMGHCSDTANKMSPVCFVYAAKSPAFPGLILIGRTLNMAERLYALNDACAPAPFVIVAAAPTFSDVRDEFGAHQFFADFRREGNFFEIRDSDAATYFKVRITGLYNFELAQHVAELQQA